MKKTENEQLKSWLSAHGAEVEAESKLEENVRLIANEWEIIPPESQDDRDARDPVYAGQSERIKALKKKKIWKFINPFYRLYANIKVRTILLIREENARKNVGTDVKRVCKSVCMKLVNKVSHRFKNRKSVIRRRNRAFIRHITLSEEELEAQRNTKFTAEVTFSVLVPLYNTPERFLRDMIESVQKQTYAKWELCLADGSDADHPEVERICMEYAGEDSRIRYKRLLKNEGISENTNECIRMSTGDYIALFDHDDVLHPAALFRCMQEIEAKGADFIYTDEMTFQNDSLENIVTLHFKPDFSPQNLKGVNYICHLSVFKRTLLEQTGLYDDAYDGSQDHDMILKLTTAAEHVSHIPEVLYFWRVHPQSVSMDISAKSYAIDAGKHAVRDNEARLGRKVSVYSSCICATHYRLEYELPDKPEVSILIAHRAGAKELGRLLDSLIKRTEYENYEIYIADLESRDEETAQLLAAAEQEAYISVKRFGADTGLAEAFLKLAEEADGKYLVFLESDMEITDVRWLDRLVMYCMQDDIAAVGGRWIDSCGMLEEAGYLIGIGADGIALPVEHKNSYSTLGYMGRMYYTHNVSALSLWGMMTEKDVFLAEGGFDQRLTDSYYMGIDYCLKQREKNLQVVLEPYILNTMYGNAFSNGMREKDMACMQQKWEAVLRAGDPYYNRNFAADGSFTYAVRS